MNLGWVLTKTQGDKIKNYYNTSMGQHLLKEIITQMMWYYTNDVGKGKNKKKGMYTYIVFIT